MEPKKLLNADYLDIIFDNRNKIYGGYELRRNYNRRVKKAAALVILGASALFSFSFITAGHNATVVASDTKPVTISEVHIVPPQPHEVPHHATPPPPSQHFNTRTFTIPKIVDNTQVQDDKQMAQNTDLHNVQPGMANTSGEPGGNNSGTGVGQGTGVVQVTDNNLNVPVVWVEQMPQFIGDMNGYIGSHIHYPALASSDGITGKVIVEFLVNEDGSVSNVKVLRGIGGGCDEEALRVVSGMPVWKPGKQNGKPVKVLFRLPITFVLN